MLPSILIAASFMPLMASPSWVAPGGQANAWFGWTVASAGDVNGDGYADVIVGAPYYDNGENSEGRAFVYYGSAAGLSSTAAWTAEGDQAGAEFGYAVATAGDVNGDGYADVVVGAQKYDNGQTDEGRAYVYYGSAGGLSSTAAWSQESNDPDGEFGWSVGTAGDVNDDGFSDLIVGSIPFGPGRAYVYHGSAAGLSTTAAWTAQGEQYLGTSVGTAGDVNGDGYADVIVGSDFYSNGELHEGRAYVYHGSAAGLSPTAAWTVESNQPDARFGHAVATAGDVNGDGYADVIVGAFVYDNGQTDEGRAYVYYGSAAGLATNAAWSAESDQSASNFGYAVATAGDVDGDGYADVIVGAYTYDGGGNDAGRVFVYHGSPAGPSTQADWTAEPGANGAWFGYSVGTAGDVNGDGDADVIVGAPRYFSEGQVFAYYGSTAGLPGPAAGSVPDSLVVEKLGGDSIRLSWAASCLATDTDYAIYEGAVGDFTSHAPLVCSAHGLTTATFTPAAGSSYYLVVPNNEVREGSYGQDSAGHERPPSTAACLPRTLGSCR